MKHILIFASYGPSLINFRLHLIKKLISRGYKVSVASPKDKFSVNLQKKLKYLGVDTHIFKLYRQSFNIFRDFFSLLEIYRILINLKPNVVISYTAKPVIYSGFILKFFKKINYYPLITGLGYAFSEGITIKKKILKFLMVKLYTQSLKSSDKIIFQNKDDQALFFKLKIFKKKNLSCVVNGSGIDLSLYPLTNLPSKPIFLMIARLLVDKGVREFVEAAKIVRLRFPNAKFKLVGGLDQNPSSISSKELHLWINQGNIEYLGELKSVQSILQSSKFFVLPSYREGTPRSILEALSTGRPVITTNSPGCRETVIHGKNGLLVPVRNATALAKAMIKLLNEKEETLKKMAKESYLIAKNKFEIGKVNKSMLKIMNL
jgi:glycosyltransferase involved in cell wall biosynthesis